MMEYDREGRPIDMWTWARLHADHEYRRVAEDLVGDIWVSTVWLGLDHNWMPGGRPIIFETMVFDQGTTETINLGGGDREYHPSLDEFSRRYCTEDEAMAGHKEVVAEVAAMMEAVRQIGEETTNGD